MRCLRLQQLHIPLQRTWKLPHWTVRFIILIIHLLNQQQYFSKTHIYNYLCLCKLAPPLFACSCDSVCTISTNTALTVVLRASCMCTTGRLQIMFLQAVTSSAECFGYKSQKKNKPERSETSLHWFSPLRPLRHITRNPHITNSHDSSHSRWV